MKNLALLLISFFVLAACSNSQSQQKGVIESVDAKRFKELVDANKGTVLDVRTQDEVDEGYIKHAVHLDIYKSDFEKRINQLPKDKEVYVYCRAGGRSMDASKILQKNGFTKVYNLKDGMNAWEESGYPIEKKE